MRMVHTPLSLRDISPARGEIIFFPRPLIGWGKGCDSVADNLPPCGGDVGVADRGGYSSIIYSEAYRPCP